MTTKASIETFFSGKKLAVVGVSRSGKKFGSAVFRELKSKGFTVYAINPGGGSVDGDAMYPGFDALPEPVDGAVFVIKPAETDGMVKKAVDSGIRNIWLQQGAESETAIAYCASRDVNVIHGECVFMFAEPLAFGHRIHRWIWKLLGKYPG